MTKPRVIIADDHQLVVAALKEMLARDYDIAETVYDGGFLSAAVERIQPDMVLLDISMPPNGGLELLATLHQLHPKLPIIIVTMNESMDIAAQALRLGALAYVLKSSAPSELGEAMRRVMKGEVYVTPRIAGGIIDSLTKPIPQRYGMTLSGRQREVLRLLAEGKSMKEAASALNVAVATVSFHRYRMMKQLKIKTTAELIRFAVAQHIV